MSRATAQDWPSEARGWLVTVTLLVGFTFSFIDRQVLNLLVEPIQADLDISDTEISFLQGFAFVITYVAMSIPLGRLVDRYNRMRIMVGGVLFWSAATVTCGLSRNYTELLTARLGVGARRGDPGAGGVVGAGRLFPPAPPGVAHERLPDGPLSRRRAGNDCGRRSTGLDAPDGHGRHADRRRPGTVAVHLRHRRHSRRADRRPDCIAQRTGAQRPRRGYHCGAAMASGLGVRMAPAPHLRGPSSGGAVHRHHPVRVTGLGAHHTGARIRVGPGGRRPALWGWWRW